MAGSRDKNDAAPDEKERLTNTSSSDDTSLDREKEPSGCLPSLKDFFASFFKKAPSKPGILDAQLDNMMKADAAAEEAKRTKSLPTASSDDKDHPVPPPSKSM